MLYANASHLFKQEVNGWDLLEHYCIKYSDIDLHALQQKGIVAAL
jgi:hypothetical protein